jgi:hypothetical protein
MLPTGSDVGLWNQQKQKMLGLGKQQQNQPLITNFYRADLVGFMDWLCFVASTVLRSGKRPPGCTKTFVCKLVSLSRTSEMLPVIGCPQAASGSLQKYISDTLNGVQKG